MPIQFAISVFKAIRNKYIPQETGADATCLQVARELAIADRKRLIVDQDLGYRYFATSRYFYGFRLLFCFDFDFEVVVCLQNQISKRNGW